MNSNSRHRRKILITKCKCKLDSIKKEVRELLKKREDYVAPEIEKLMEGGEKEDGDTDAKEESDAQPEAMNEKETIKKTGEMFLSAINLFINVSHAVDNYGLTKSSLSVNVLAQDTGTGSTNKYSVSVYDYEGVCPSVGLPNGTIVYPVKVKSCLQWAYGAYLSCPSCVVPSTSVI